MNKNFTPEIRDMWKRLESLLNNHNWGYIASDDEEVKEAGRQQETQIAILASELQSKRWDAERYVKAYWAVMTAPLYRTSPRQSQIDDYLKNPANGWDEGWYIEDGKVHTVWEENAQVDQL